MAKPILSLSQVLSDKAIFRIPRIPAFNRFEPRPRTLDFTRSLRAEVRDPLWMLTRQWQLGEFQGEDAASPVTSRIAYRHEPIQQVAFHGAASGEEVEFAYDPLKLPLETRVEAERIPLTAREMASGDIYSDILLAVQWGKKVLNLLKAAGGGLESHYGLYLEQFPLRVLPPGAAETRVVQDPEAEVIALVAGGRVADGVAIWLAVERGTHDAWLDAQPSGDKAAVKMIAASFHDACSDQFKRLFTQPENAADTAWLPNHLEYQFSAAGLPGPDGAQTVLLAEQYHGERLDWYSFDASTRRGPVPQPIPEPISTQVESFLPANVLFKSQPQPRFWEMEERQTDFGKIETSTTGLLHLLLAEFGLIYSNDWFMLPHPMVINTICEIR
jgi:hypothetical protein